MEKEMRELITPLSEHLSKQLSVAVERQPRFQISLFWIEVTIVKLLAELAVQLTVGLIGLVVGLGYRGSRMACPQCGGRMTFQRYAGRPILSGLGWLRYERAYYYCPVCKVGSAPLDEVLQVGEREVSPRLQRVMGFLSGYPSLAVVENAIWESYEVSVRDDPIRRVAEEMGQEARRWEERQRQPVEADPEMIQPRPGAPKTWILEIDGKTVGFQDGHWSEVTVGVIDELDDRVQVSEGRPELVNRELVARRCDWLAFAHHCWVALRRAGVRPGDGLVALADGAGALEQIFAVVAPPAPRRRDFYHVAERI